MVLDLTTDDDVHWYANEAPWHGIFADVGEESLYNYYSVFSKA